MKRNLMLTIFFSLFYNYGIAQNSRFGVTLNLGASKFLVETSFKENTLYSKSGNLGFFYEKIKNPNVGFGIELLLVQIEGLETFGRFISSPTAESNISETRTHISYLGFPVYHRLQRGNWGLKIGLQPMLFLFAKSHRFQSSNSNNLFFVNQSIEKTVIVKNFDLGPKIGIDCEIFNNMKLRADLFWGLIGKEPESFSQTKDNKTLQLTIGVSSFFDLKKNSNDR